MTTTMLTREEVAVRIAELPEEEQHQAIELAQKLYGEPDPDASLLSLFAEQYQFDPAGYIQDVLGWQPWSGGSDETPGQIEILEAYKLALLQQHERNDFDAGLIERTELQHWHPGLVIKNWIRAEAGHSVGKTKICSGIVSHFLDCFHPSIIYCFAPKEDQIRDLLFKEISADRTKARYQGKPLPGKINDLEIYISPEHFAKGKSFNNKHGQGTAGVQGQHGKYLLFILDEAEGIPGFVFDAVKSMTSGGIAICLMLANPQTRSSRFHKSKSLSYVKSFRISCVNHPNVQQGKEVVPGAVRRDYVEGMMEGDGEQPNVEIIPAHDPDVHSFDLKFPISIRGHVHPPGTIFKPNAEFQFRVLGIAPETGTGNTLCPSGRFEAAKKRAPEDAADFDNWTDIRIGVDVARFGGDFGTVYLRYRGVVKRVAQLYHERTGDYLAAIRDAAMEVYDKAPKGSKPTSLHVRLDGSGGFGSGVADALLDCRALKDFFEDYVVIEVPFNASPSKDNEKRYDNIITEAYGECALKLKGMVLLNTPGALETDFCERPYGWTDRGGHDVKALESKDKFRSAQGRSPDDGDGFALCGAPDRVFEALRARVKAKAFSYKIKR